MTLAPDDPRLGPRANAATHRVLERACETFYGTMRGYGWEQKEARYITATLAYVNVYQRGSNLNLAAILVALGDAIARGHFEPDDVEKIRLHLRNGRRHLATAAGIHEATLDDAVRNRLICDQAFMRRFAASFDSVMYGGRVSDDV